MLALFELPIVFIPLMLVALALFCFGSYQSDKDNTVSVSAALAMIGGFFLLVTHLGTPFAWFAHNAGTVALTVLAYLVIGVVWAFIKWGFHASSIARAFKTLVSEFATRNNVPVTSLRSVSDPAFLKNLDSTLDSAFKHYYQPRTSILDFAQLVKAATPQAARSKSRIVNWIAYWPASLLNTLLSEFVINLFNNIYRFISGSLQRFADSKFRDI